MFQQNRFRTFKRWIIVIISCLVLPLTGYSQQLRVAVAANAQFVAEKLKEAFEKETGTKLELIVSSSGKLTAQIKQGAPFDVFLSADMKYPQALANEKLTIDKPRVYAYGTLVCWTLKNIDLSKGAEAVLVTNVKKVAVANAKTAPYGEAAMQVMQALKVYEEAKPKLVYGESIAQVNQYLLSGAADLAFTSKSVVMEPQMKNKGKWIEVDHKLYTPIAQGVVILKYAQKQHLKEAQSFYQFLFSPAAKAIFLAYGYQVEQSTINKSE